MSEQVPTRIIPLQATAFNIGKAVMCKDFLCRVLSGRNDGGYEIYRYVCLGERISDDHRNSACLLLNAVTADIKAKVIENYLILRMPAQEVNSDQRLFLKTINSRVFGA